MKRNSSLSRAVLEKALLMTVVVVTPPEVTVSVVSSVALRVLLVRSGQFNLNPLKAKADLAGSSPARVPLTDVVPLRTAWKRPPVHTVVQG
jgi:hypothetical protein